MMSDKHIGAREPQPAAADVRPSRYAEPGNDDVIRSDSR